MAPFIIALIIIIGLIFGVQRILASRRQEGGRDYENFFQENAKKH